MQTRRIEPSSMPAAAVTGAGIHVLSRLNLLTQAVCAGLVGQGLPVDALTWPAEPRALRERILDSDVIVLLDDLETRGDLRRVQRLLQACPARWLVLTSRPADASWGALLEAGAWAVLPSSVSLDDVDGKVRAVRNGREVTDPEDRRTFARLWAEQQRDEQALVARMDQLTRRERLTLDLLERGYGVPGVAGVMGVSEEAVRSRIKAVLRKLGVHSQLAAVAVARRHHEITGPVDVPRPR